MFKELSGTVGAIILFGVIFVGIPALFVFAIIAAAKLAWSLF